MKTRSVSLKVALLAAAAVFLVCTGCTKEVTPSEAEGEASETAPKIAEPGRILPTDPLSAAVLPLFTDDYTETSWTRENLYRLINESSAPAELKDAVERYFSGLELVKDTIFSEFIIEAADLDRLLIEKSPNCFILILEETSPAADTGSAPDASIWWPVDNEYPKSRTLSFGPNVLIRLSEIPQDKRIFVFSPEPDSSSQNSTYRTVLGLRLLGYDAVQVAGDPERL